MKKIIMLTLIFSLMFITGCKEKEYFNQELNSKILDSNIVHSTVLIVKEKMEISNELVTSTTYSSGFSGVIFNKCESKYYIMTSRHSIEEITTEKLYILASDEPRYSELENDQKKGVQKYYESKSIGHIEYSDPKFDLAIISFHSNLELPIATISKKELVYGEQIATISNPQSKKRNHISFGKIISKNPVPFGDNKNSLEYNIIEHDAYISEGSSGSMLINDNLEVIGINLGGTTKQKGKFIKAKAMPSNRILEFINEYKKITY